MTEYTPEQMMEVLKRIEKFEKEKSKQLENVEKDLKNINEKRMSGNPRDPKWHKLVPHLQAEISELRAELDQANAHKELVNKSMEKAKSALSAEDHRTVGAAHEKYGSDNKEKSNIGPGAKKLASGALGLVGGAFRGAGGFIKSLGSQKGSGGYKDPSDRSLVNGLIFVVFFFFILIYEMLGGGYLNNIDVVRFFYAIIFLTWGWLSFPEERGSVWIVFVYTIMAPLLMSFIGNMPFIAQSITNATIYHTIILFMFPAILYYMLFSESVRLPKIFGIARFVLVASILILALGFTDSADVVNRLQASGGDTGFSFEKAMQGLAGGFEGFGSGFLEPVVCALNPNCGFNNWLTSITEPFANDGTTVHDIQNKDLGLYVENVRMSSAMDLTGLQFQFLPEPISFFIRAPIPERLGFELCNIQEGELKGFTNICKSKVVVGCEVQDAGGTKVLPEPEITIADAIGGRSTLYQCLIANPRLGTKKVNLSVTYDFVTNTYKLIRAVDATQVLTRQAQEELSRLPSNYIISTGGPVIVESDESNYISVKPEGTETNLLIRLRAQNNVRLVSVDNIELYLPSGMKIVPGQDSLCNFEIMGIEEGRTVEGVYQDCLSQGLTDYNNGVEPGLKITNLEDACNSVQTERGAVLACRILDACSAQRERNAFQQNNEYENAYEISVVAKEAINTLLEGPAKQKAGNDIVIGCLIEINKTEFLYENALRGVTERALNIVSYYKAEHQATGNIRFTGTTVPISNVALHDVGDQICNDRTTGLSVPMGQLPLGNTEVVSLTHPFGSTQDPLSRKITSYVHRGIDLAGTSGLPVMAAWNGSVFKVVSDCTDTSCKSYGNKVVLESTDTKGNVFYHIYSHLAPNSIPSSIKMGEKVSRGTPLGTQGNTGDSTGPHLHFEVRVGQQYHSGKLMNPLPCVDHSRIGASDEFKTLLRSAQAGVTYTYPIVPFASSFPEGNDVEDFIQKLRDKGDEARAQFATRIAKEAEGKVDLALAIAIAIQESNLNHYTNAGQVKVSSGNAVGLMQVVPSTAQEMCSEFEGLTRDQAITKLRNVDENIRCGIQVLSTKPDKCKPEVQRCDCVITRQVDGVRMKLDDYSETYYGRVQGYVGWACSPHPHYVEGIHNHLITITGTAPTLPPSSLT